MYLVCRSDGSDTACQERTNSTIRLFSLSEDQTRESGQFCPWSRCCGPYEDLLELGEPSFDRMNTLLERLSPTSPSILLGRRFHSIHSVQTNLEKAHDVTGLAVGRYGCDGAASGLSRLLASFASEDEGFLEMLLSCAIN